VWSIQEELHDAIVRLTGKDVGEATLNRMVKFLDTDGNGTIDKMEFRTGLKRFAKFQDAGVFDDDEDSDLDELELTPDELKQKLVRPINE